GKRFRSDELEPKSGWVLSFIGAVDFDSFARLFKEQQFPERSAIWSRVDLAPLLRKIFTNSGGGFDERRRVGYWQLGDRFDERREALRALIGQRLFSVSSLQPFSAMEIDGNQNSISLSEGGRSNPAIKVAQDFYRKRGIRDPVVILGNVHWTEQ